ncbi:hypothetical protein [Nocardioides sp. zg-DK7169]|uniref:hypothetical protein n=1 Tax=Nocardioides sp. zg-DK7169 TaxID=2736600 RepID=UPI001552C68B|nr:hypothetical protein [Nocardioides sp. zg-DK7169]NPC96808.1 hypothetical protein [Nocardioides sp. zg-DK7169]
MTVEDLAGRSVYAGILSIEFQAQGSSVWKLISRTSGRTPSIYDWDATRARGNGTYRATFVPSDSQYAGSTTSRTLKVQRDLGEPRVVRKGARAFAVGKVSPGFARKKLVVQKRTGRTWARFSTVRTDAKGRFRAQLAVPPRRAGAFEFRVQIKAGGGFAKTQSPRLRVRR